MAVKNRDTPKSKHSGGIVSLVVVGIVALAVIGYVYLTAWAPVNNDGVTLATLTVSGEVNPGADRRPVSLLFRDNARAETENVSFEGTHYKIELPNGNYDWQITVLWHGTTNGQCDGGILSYQRMKTTTITNDISC